MSGHNKWSSIKHRKGAVDAKRGKIFTKLIKEITVAARQGGGDLDANPRLRTAIAAAKAVNMPKDNIERSIKRGTGELEGVSYEELFYEGYGPGGVAVMVDILTDNRNRTAADIRHIFNKGNGNLGENGCVAWMFDTKGLIVFEKENIGEEELFNLALEAGADDVEEIAEDGIFEVITTPESFEAVKQAFDEKGWSYASAEVTKIPQNTIKLEGKAAEQMLRLMEKLEDSDDVQNVYANFDIDMELIEQLQG
ncbi:MAG: YebC/PmpR family DNA-binding transcriptional regulator [Pseudomonadota bacterium]|nr:YebC/PmpR family DNA-binding transcriptional regulator [Pseudomonadota bacterium]MEA3241354.1 YebC/PmpR family DNA-binding transcriptional regulator [Pseudomonadota bacterium]